VEDYLKITSGMVEHIFYELEFSRKISGLRKRKPRNDYGI